MPNKKKQGKLILICILGGSAVLLTSMFFYRNKYWKGIENTLYVSELKMVDANYTEGKLNRYFNQNADSETVVSIPFESFEINKNGTKIIGTVIERQNDFYGIVEYDMENEQRTDILDYENLQENVRKYGISNNNDEILRVKFGDMEDEYTFLYAGKLWELSGGAVKPIADVPGRCYEWLDEETIMIEKDGDMITYNIHTGETERMFEDCQLNGEFMLSNNREFVVYEGVNKHGLYKYSLKTGTKQYLTGLEGSADIAISDNDKYIAYFDSYYTITHSGITKLYIMDLESGKKKALERYSGTIAGGPAWGIK